MIGPYMLGWLLISAAFGAMAFAVSSAGSYRLDPTALGLGIFVALLLAGIGFVAAGLAA